MSRQEWRGLAIGLAYAAMLTAGLGWAFLYLPWQKWLAVFFMAPVVLLIQWLGA